MTFNLANNLSSPDKLIIWLSQEITGFSSYILAFIFFIIVILGSGNETDRFAKSNLFQWLTVASLICAFLAIFIFILGAMSIIELSLWIVIFIICVVLMSVLN